jgi:hypothetical protein
MPPQRVKGAGENSARTRQTGIENPQAFPPIFAKKNVDSFLRISY